MATEERLDIIEAVLDLFGKTFAEELGIVVQGNSPEALFQLLCAALLFSARISARIATDATKALLDMGWTTPTKMAATTWEERTRALNRSGYARYDESTSRMLGESTELLLQRYDGDLRNLRSEAGRDPGEERRKLKEFKGIGDVGVDIFFREAQVTWDELFPFMDRRSKEGARALGLPDDPVELLELCERDDYPRLVAGLVRAQLEDGYERIQEQAGVSPG